ncbi:MAG TPA: FtsQ-type POTRA domain-containing protein [bacterium]|nr:FtsQ-type POTRA domain-containing protein [bacterium]HPT29569.1 FtsQ-type POTRA domain-containing protein [bacterium]
MSTRAGQPYKNRVRKDYCRKELENPFYRQNKANQGLDGRSKKFFIFSFIILVGVLTWLFFASPVFIIKRINITGTNRISADEVRTAVWAQADNKVAGIFSQHNLWLFKRDKITPEIQDHYHLASLMVKKKMFHTLEITIQERDYVFIWQEEGKSYYLDAAGNLVDEIYSEPVLEQPMPEVMGTTSSTTSSTTVPVLTTKPVLPAGYPVIDNQSVPRLKENRLDIDPGYLNCSKGIYDAFKADNNSQLTGFFLDQEYNTLKARLSSGVVVYLSPQSDCDKQIRNLMVLLKGDYKDKIKTKIDLRYGDKIFYE